MDTKINFFKIGIFIVIFTLLLLGIVFWLGKYGFEKKKYDDYSIYFKESISGLNIGSAIKYKGFEVGKVNEIKINPENSEEIELDIEIKKGTPIKEDNYAILGSLGITGLKYIELKGGTNNSALLKANEEGKKVIPSKPSALATLFDSTEDITTEFMIVLNQIKKVINDENIEAFSKFLTSSERSMSNIDQISSYLVDGEKRIDDLLKKLSNLTDVSSKSFTDINKSANSFKEFSNEFLKQLQEGSFNIKELSQESLNKINKVLDNLDDTLTQGQKLIDDLEESPSDILFKQKNIKYGPGEKDEK
ncbi:MlaD family protein [Poseidonibacter antarcticus]|uniref:MlaD family protein n=1 Tax=Poseidonibacter antarcticus TaxID=2478538 RepID=UPI000EF49089|nr:MlaD family protein [Poseidonibacter antarcticus]